MHLLLAVLGLAPGVLRKLLGLLQAVGDQDVVKDGAGLDLPQLEANVLDVLLQVQLVVVLVLRVVDVGRNPDALVGGVVDPAGIGCGVVGGGWQAA